MVEASKALSLLFLSMLQVLPK